MNPKPTKEMKPKYVLMNELELFSHVVVDPKRENFVFLLQPFKVIHLEDSDLDNNVINERIGLHKWPHYVDNNQVPVFQNQIQVIMDLNPEFREFYYDAIKEVDSKELDDTIPNMLSEFTRYN
tara:strand:+ start:2123 stop:2491 length:369 start_codon:yes stop_codon:yes gene_type:complete